MSKMRDDLFPNPTPWVREGCGLRGQNRFVVDLQPGVGIHEYGRLPSIVIEELNEPNLAPSGNGGVELYNHDHCLRELYNRDPSMVIADTEADSDREPKRGRSTSKRDLEGVSSEKGISAQKKLKLGVDRSKEGEREEQAAARVGTIQISSRCLLLDSESYTEGSLQEVSMEKQVSGEVRQMIHDGKKMVGRSKKTGSSSRGGGGWPFSAAKSP
ncbi:hypothetical protein ACFX1Z_024614 [Malus domestica]